MVKACVRRETCRFLHWDKIGDKQMHENFQARIAQLSYERNNADAQRALALNSEIEQTTAKWETFLDKINKKRLELNLGRKRYEDQRSSKYFFRRFNAIPGSSSLMYDKEGNSHSEDADILAICHKFYTDLYNKPEKPHSTPYAFIPDQSSPRLLNDLDRNLLSENIDIDEMYKALQGMRKNKAPGLDGLTVQFYLAFWTEISPILLQCIQFVQEQKCLSPSQHRGIVKLIPKKDKNPAWVQNLRPITLLNLDVKICTRTLALRLRVVIQDLIERDQQAFIQGRYLGNSMLDLYAAAAAALEQDDDFLAISLDIEKAFDSVQWPFLYKVLKGFGFPQYFVNWIKILHNNKELRIFNNGHSSKPVQDDNLEKIHSRMSVES